MCLGRGLLVAMILTVSGCGRAPATLARTHPAPMTVEASGPARWIDREAGVVEQRVACRPTTIEVWCREHGRTTCESRRIVAEATACPGEAVTVTTGWGDTVQAMVSPDGLAVFTVDPARSRSLPPPPPPPPPLPSPAVPQRSYRGAMVGADLAILVSAPFVIVAAGGDNAPRVGALYLAAYLAAGPFIHASNGSEATGRSLLRRALYPLPGLAAGSLLAFAMIQGCDEDIGCAAAPALVLLAGGAIGVVAALVHDWRDAKVDAAPARITPVITGDGEHTTFGLAGRF